MANSPQRDGTFMMRLSGIEVLIETLTTRVDELADIATRIPSDPPQVTLENRLHEQAEAASERFTSLGETVFGFEKFVHDVSAKCSENDEQMEKISEIIASIRQKLENVENIAYESQQDGKSAHKIVYAIENKSNEARQNVNNRIDTIAGRVESLEFASSPTSAS